MHKAVSGLGTAEHVLTDVMIGHCNASMLAVMDAYKRKYNHDMEKVLSKDVHGDYKTVIVHLMRADRDEMGTQFSDVEFDVHALYKAGPGKLGTDEKTYMNILTKRSVMHLRNVFQAYHRTYDKDIRHHIKSEFSGDAERAILALVDWIAYFLFFISLPVTLLSMR